VSAAVWHLCGVGTQLDGHALCWGEAAQRRRPEPHPRPHLLGLQCHD
jgi:hypothetical protein